MLLPELPDTTFYVTGEPTLAPAEDANADDTAPMQPEAPDEEEQHDYQRRELLAQHGANIVRYVERLHRNLGHPRPQILLQMLNAANARPEVSMRPPVPVPSLCRTTPTRTTTQSRCHTREDV
jgi:hypothetical protein